MIFIKNSYFKRLLFISLVSISQLQGDDILEFQFLQTKKLNSEGSISISIRNSSKEEIKVLKWNTPFEESLNSDVFVIKNNNHIVPYMGKVIKRGQPQESDYIKLEPKEQRNINIKLSDYYDMSKKGNYSITYKGNISLLNSSNQKHTVITSLKKNTKVITIPFQPTKSQKKKSQKLTADFTGCSEERKNYINDAHTEAIAMSKESLNRMVNTTEYTSAERYTTWFGLSVPIHQNQVTKSLQRIYDTLDREKLKFDCETCTYNAFAYVYPDKPYDIYLCGAFWEAEVSGTDSKAGTLIHEVSHFNKVADTNDYAYGQSRVKSLAKTSPDRSIKNADSYEYFSENNPKLSMYSENSKANNIFTNAPTFTSLPFTDTLEQNDLNIYKFVPSKSSDYLFYSKGELDTIAQLYDNEHNFITSHDDIGRGNLNFMLLNNFKKNTPYYLIVSQYSDTASGSYSIHGLNSFRSTTKKSDFNSDRISDILWEKDKDYSIWYMNKDGSYNSLYLGVNDKSFKLEAIHDFNSDGISDILWRKGSKNMIWYMTKSGTYTEKNIGNKSSSYTIVKAGDFDGNGIADILWKKGTVYSLWYMNEDGTHSYKRIGSKNSSYEVINIADFNKDGIEDILWKKDKYYSLWYMNEDGTHTYKYIGSKNKAYTIIDIDDFNGDGVTDILWKKGKYYSLWYMNKNGTHKYKYIGSKDTSYTIAKVADMNGDNIADILWRKKDKVYMWYMKATGGHKYKAIGSKSKDYSIQN